MFIWSGKGYRVIVDTFLGFLLFGVIIQIARDIIPDRGWYWGIALMVSSAAVWIDGRRLNAKRRNAVRSINARDKIFYRARHTAFMMPMETFAYIMLAGGLWWFVADLMRG